MILKVRKGGLDSGLIMDNGTDFSKGAEELDVHGCGLNVRDAVMEKIFVVDTTRGAGEK